MEEVRLIDANALHKRIEMNLHASNPFTIEESTPTSATVSTTSCA